MEIAADVVIATYRRPDYLRTCLGHLRTQSVSPRAIVVVDASQGEEAGSVADEFAGVIYVRNGRGPGSTATSRAIGMKLTDSEVVAFLDDDAYADPEWLENLLRPYADQSVGAVGGRARNDIFGEETQGVDQIGRLLPNGRLTGFFAADPGRDIDVDHLLGANMSVRRSAVDEVGGIHDLYPGTCLCEETDIALRIRQAGYRIVFTPSAVVEHVAGPYARGSRFDTRYKYYAVRNHVVLLGATLGSDSSEFRCFLREILLEIVSDLVATVSSLLDPQRRGVRRKVTGMIGGPVRAITKTAGLAAGLTAAVRT